MTRPSGYLILLGLLLAGGGITGVVSLIMPLMQQDTVERAPEARIEPPAAAAPAPVVQNESALPAAEPAQSAAETQQPVVPTSSDEQQPAPKPAQAEASIPPEPPQLAPESLIPAEPLPPPQTPTQLAALPPPEVAAPVEPPAPVAKIARSPDVPLPRERPAELTSEATALAADLFSKLKSPSSGPAQVIGFYSAGCIAGAQQLALQGPYWQVMRPSRDRYWGHPELIAFIERVAHDVAAHTVWPGILIGDMAQPRGGPLPAGHASHQIGLDVDIWLKPMPKEPFTRAQADSVPMVSVVAADNKQLDKSVWQPEDATLIKIAAEQPEVERIFVNPVIKKELCRTQTPADATWMPKVRPWYGHDEHIHIRLKCPPGSPECREQESVPDGDGCGKALEHWFKPGILAIEERLRTQAPVNRMIKMRALPGGCFAVLHAPAGTNQVATGQ